MSLAVSTCVLFIHLVPTVNGAHFFLIYIYILMEASAAAETFGIVIFPLRSMYESL